MIENQKTITELEERLAQRETEYKRNELVQSALYKIAEAASSVTDLQEFYKRLHQIIGELMYAGNFFIAIYDEQTGMLSWPYHVDEKDLDQSFWIPEIYKDDRGATSYVIRTGKSMLASQDQTELLEKGEIEIIGANPNDAIFIPLAIGEKTLGALAIQSYTKGIGYTQQDEQILIFVARHIANALARARAIEETRQRVSELEIINSIQQGLASKLELQAIVDLVGDKLRSILNTDEIGIRLYDEKADLINYLYEFEHGERLTIAPMKPSALFRQVQKDHQPVFGKTSEISVKYGLINVPGTEISKSLANVPIIAGDRVIGGISVENYEREDAFDESNIRLMKTIAASMGVALENARLFDETQRLFKAEQQRAAELAIINSVQEGLASKLDMQAIYDLVGDKIRDIFEAQSVSIMIYDRHTETEYYPYLIEKGHRYQQDPIEHDENGFGPFVMRTRAPMMINQDMDKRRKEVGSYDLAGDPGERIQSGIWSPLIVGDEAKGVISVANMDRENAFAESDLRLLTTLANSMSVALENARLFDETQRLFKAEQQRAAELAIINSVQAGLASKLDMQAIYDLVGDKIREIFKTDTAYIVSYKREQQLVFSHYYVDKGNHIPPQQIPFGKGL